MILQGAQYSPDTGLYPEGLNVEYVSREALDPN